MVVEMGVREKPRPGPEYLMQLMNDKKLMSSLPNFCGTSRTWSGCWTKLDELDEKKVENNEQREGIICLKQERQYLGNELTLAVEREKRKDQILELARSQQERADTELHGLRQVNEKQQHDLQLLHLNLGSSQELIRKQEEKILEIGEERLELNTFGLESPLRSMNSSPIRERPRGKSSLHSDLCVNDSVSPVRVNANEE